MTDNTLSLDEQWEVLMGELTSVIGKRPADLNSVLFLIGVQELGMGARRFEKEQKQDLMHVGICKLLSISGYYEFEKIDKDGWPHYKLITQPPFGNLEMQEQFLKMHILEYFKDLF